MPVPPARILQTALCFSLMLALTPKGRAEPAPVASQPAGDRAQAAAGLKWLSEKIPAKADDAARLDTASIALAGLAFLGSGSTPEQGEFHESLAACLRVMLTRCQPSGLIGAKPPVAAMYGHGYATLFLAETYRANHDVNLKPPLERAVQLIEHSQGKQGGWRYQPLPADADVSVTACVLNSLLAARAAGIPVKARIIDNAVSYILSCQTPDGGFSYLPGTGDSGPARSAAAIAVLHRAAPLTAKEAILRADAYLAKEFSQGAEPLAFWSYSIYYGAQAMHSAGADLAGKSLPALASAVAKKQAADGSWSGDHGDFYTTANALLVLQCPHSRLWIFGGG